MFVYEIPLKGFMQVSYIETHWFINYTVDIFLPIQINIYKLTVVYRIWSTKKHDTSAQKNWESQTIVEEWF